MGGTVRVGIEKLEDAAEELQECHSEKLKADRYHFVVAEVAKQDLESSSRVYPRQRLQDSFDEVDVAADGHFEGEAIGEGGVLADGLKNVGVLRGHDGLGGESQVPELDEERLQGLDLEDLSQRHAREGVVRVHSR
jgi:hypothetical protein